jgi:hypothetical protein
VAYWAQVAALGRTIREIRRGLRAIPDALKVPLSLSRRWQLARAASNCGAIATLSRFLNNATLRRLQHYLGLCFTSGLDARVIPYRIVNAAVRWGGMA